MPAVIPFLATGDNYPTDNEAGAPIIGPLQQIANITFQIQGTNNVYFQVARKNKDNSVSWDETDLPAVPGSGGFSGRAYGIKFKSATPGQPATVSAIAFFNDDAVPFQAVNQGSGGGGSGTIGDITSSTLVVTNPTGPTVDIETPYLGTISDIISTDGSVTITNPTGPTVNISSPGSNPGLPVTVPVSITIGTRSLQPAVANFGSSVGHFGLRVIIPRSGTLHDLAVYIGNSAGSIEVAILDTSTPTRNILYKSGLIAASGTNAWQIVADPALNVLGGQQVDLVTAFTSASNTVLWFGGLVNTSAQATSGTLPLNYLPVAGGAPPKLTWLDSVSAIPYGSATTVPESSLVAQQNMPLVIGRIA